MAIEDPRHLRSTGSIHLGADDDTPKSASALVERKLLESRTVLVHGPVTDEMAAALAGRLMVLESLDADAPVTVLINSPGGSADSGFAMYDMIRFVRCPVKTVVNGLCASAGILVHLAGDKGMRFATPESRFMIHQPSTAGQGTASDLDITAREVIKLRERYNAIIAEECGQKVEDVLEKARRDWWLNSKEALDYGLIDKIAAAHADLD